MNTQEIFHDSESAAVPTHSYDPEAVAFYDIAHEGAQLRVVAEFVRSGGLDAVQGTQPRSVVVVTTEAIATHSAHVSIVLHAPLKVPVIVTAELPRYVGPLDIVIVATERSSSEHLSQALTTAMRRGCMVILVSASGGMLHKDAAQEAIVVPSLPLIEGPSPLRIIAVVMAVLALLEQDQERTATVLEESASHVDAEIMQCSPEYGENANRARQLAQITGHIIHTGTTASAVAVANLIAVLWTSYGKESTSLPATELGAALGRFSYAVKDIFFDPDLDKAPTGQSLKTIAWCEPEPDAWERTEHIDAGSTGTPLRMIARGFAATAFISS
ncbi:hypothetical protein CpMEX2_02565 [Corynebacterium pseudotuberculosis]|uniref:hypothetical protein n=1 Tax=Corynebacterium pseudotuberculosis TaxID=1719 RepID=UPI0006BB5EC3|nr:hypothetical protein [Corynebacterium pseudotuberculosis]ALF57072.1 hypothetical protein AN902_02550 [Corynebacterium pseudotuberculosis]ANH25334.1 Hypothetical protein CpMEX9_0525 [Corynebacterium pseudotuberculosis]APZ31287.1 Hypothetical protein CpMEX1_0525 [Corynebacterium pseudotuberculosis]QGX58652.1 hypothetical protein CpMEX2_02565 [Corynebacterium pseudotuberculosis]